MVIDDKVEQAYLSSKHTFERLLERVKAMANVLDYVELPKYEIDPVKTNMSSMVIKKRVQPYSGGSG